MYYVGLKMLIGDRAKFFSLVSGIAFASLIMNQQPSIFWGLMKRSYSFITDTNYPDLWVMDPTVRDINDVKSLSDNDLYRVRGIPGVAWAVPIYKGVFQIRKKDGNFESAILIGIDDSSLIGGPPHLLEGKLADLRKNDAVIIDKYSAYTNFATTTSDGRIIPAQIGEVFEINDKRAQIVGVTDLTRTFFTQPVIYTTYTKALNFLPAQRKMLSFVLVGLDSSYDPQAVKKNINGATGLASYTSQEFKDITFDYYMDTGIPINFGITVLLGFIIGAAIAGQTFYNFTLENLKQFAGLKAMGASNTILLRVMVFQALIVGVLGYSLGVGLTALFGYSIEGSRLAFSFEWFILGFSAIGVVLIISLSSLVSIAKVFKVDAGEVFK